jgi:hypothetical protein
MAVVKITELPELFANNLANVDVVPIVDINTDVTKRISISELQTFIAYANDYVTYSIVTDNLAQFAAYANVYFTTNAHIDTKVLEVVDSAPTSLNTLGKIATAIGNNPNYVASTNTEIAAIETRRSDNTFYQYDVATVTMEANLVSNSQSTLGTTTQRWSNAYADVLNLGSFEITQTRTSNVNSMGATVFSLDKNSFNSAKLVVNVEDLTYGQYQSSELLLVQDKNTTVRITEYAIVHTSTNPIAVFEADFVDSNAVLRVYAASSDNIITVLQFVN